MCFLLSVVVALDGGGERRGESECMWGWGGGRRGTERVSKKGRYVYVVCVYACMNGWVGVF